MKIYLISAALFRHFRYGASEWRYPRVRQALVQTRQLGKDSVTDHSYNLRTNCARLILPTTEGTHYVVQSIQPKTRDNFVFKATCTDSVQAAKTFANQKKAVLVHSDKKPAVVVNQMRN